MGHRNPDRITLAERRHKGETVAKMIANRWDVITKCPKCGLMMQVDLQRIARDLGGSTILWNRRPHCRRIGCTGRVEFMAQAPEMSWHEPLNAPDTRLP